MSESLKKRFRDRYKKIVGPGTIINYSSHVLDVVADGVRYRLLPRSRSPAGVDVDAFRAERGSPIYCGFRKLHPGGPTGWVKFRNGVLAEVQSRDGGLAVDFDMNHHPGRAAICGELRQRRGLWPGESQ